MLINSPDSLDGKNAYSSWGAKKILVCTVITALLGLAYGLALGFLHGVDGLGPGALFASVFGGFVGLVAGLLFASIRKLRVVATGSTIRTALVFAVLAGIPGALAFSLFSEGLAMALYQALYGSIVGGMIGAVLGLLIARFSSR